MALRRILPPLLAACALLAAQAPSAAAACTLRTAGPASLHTITARCDGRTARIRRPARIGVVGIVAAAAGGDWVAWVETYQRGDASAARVLRTRPAARRPRVRRVWSSELDVPTRLVVSSRAEIAFTTSRGLRLALPGRRARLIAPDAGASVRLDDDRTLVWQDDATGEVSFRDLPRARTPAGCRPRRFHVPLLRTPDVEVSFADFRDPKAFEPGATLVRACLLARGSDPVIAQALQNGTREEDVRPVGADRAWVLLARGDARRRDVVVLESLDARDGREGRRAEVPVSDAPPTPRFGEAPAPVAITEGGAPAWLVRRAEGDRLLAISAAGAVSELDRGPAGSITALRAEGALVKWSGPAGSREAAP